MFYHRCRQEDPRIPHRRSRNDCQERHAIANTDKWCSYRRHPVCGSRLENCIEYCAGDESGEQYTRERWKIEARRHGEARSCRCRVTIVRRRRRASAYRYGDASADLDSLLRQVGDALGGGLKLCEASGRKCASAVCYSCRKRAGINAGTHYAAIVAGAIRNAKAEPLLRYSK